MSAYSMGYDAGLNAGANMVLQRQFAKEIQENNTIRGACLQELARKDLDVELILDYAFASFSVWLYLPIL